MVVNREGRANGRLDLASLSYLLPSRCASRGHPNICPPHQPQKQAYVERYHRSYKYEWRLLHRPGTRHLASEVTRAYQEHYNWQRPHQGRSCHNVPPRIAHPDLPHLPALPAEVDPDRWVDRLHGRAYVRHVGADGCVTVDERPYYVGLEHKGKTVARLFNAPGRCFEVWEGRSLLKRLPIKGLQGAPLPLERFIAWMREQAIAEERRGTRLTRRESRGWTFSLVLGSDECGAASAVSPALGRNTLVEPRTGSPCLCISITLRLLRHDVRAPVRSR